MDCTSNCLSKYHSEYLTSAFTIEDLDTLKVIIEQKCSNPLRNSDSSGRTILHICSSVGRYDVLAWLCDKWKIANILSTKDKESGWTSLHRALYYGHIDCAILIYKIVQDWYAVDAEGHTPLDLLVLDSPRTKKMKIKKARLAVVVLPFESGEAGELTLHSGDVVEILHTNRSGWAVGRLQGNGNKGLFPINFVEEVPQVVPAEPCQRFQPTNNVYMWGNNVNYALGLGDSKNRMNPELLECLWLDNRNVKHCVVTKFHSVFLTKCGNVFTCGHGLGGRLGHGQEDTVLYPKLVEYFENIHCTAIDAAYSHTIVLDEMGQVYTFGFNDFFQLGHNPPPSSCLSPKQIVYKSLKNKIVIGVAAGRFHSVIYTKNEIYTFGLNAGQLGHPVGDKFLSAPKLVSHLYKKDISITSVVASDGATVCLLDNGDLYLFQDYTCRKIALRLFDVSVISITGGVLQSTDLESFNKPQPLTIAILHHSGVVDVWKPGFNSLKMCYWLGQKLSHSKVIHISLGRHLILTTDAGQVYFGHFLNKHSVSESQTGSRFVSITPKKVEVQSGTFSLSEIVEKCKKERCECEEVNLVKIPLLYRCLKCFSDSKSRTFSAIQSDARTGLTKYPSVRASQMRKDLIQMLNSASVNDDIHDAIVKVKSCDIPVHQFVIKSRLTVNELELFRVDASDDKKITYSFPCKEEDAMTWLEKIYVGEDTTSTPVNMGKENLEFDDISFAENLSSLAFADLDSPVSSDILSNVLLKKNPKKKKKSAYAIHQDKKKSPSVKSNNKYEKTPKVSKEILTLGTLSNWRKQNELSDVTIESEDGILFHCHKCILTSRAEYFNNMLNNTWIESSICKGGKLKIPIPGNILDVVINFLYTDEANSLQEISDTTFIGEVLICADQMLLTRLKDICELELADKVYLKNAIEIYQFSCDYSVEQLKRFMCEFLSLNLAFFLEAKLLECLSDESLQLLSKEYRNSIVGMEKRMIKPSIQHRISDEVEKSLQETVINDLNRIKSRRGRLSSSRSKSVSNVIDSDFESCISIQQLPNDVFEKSSPCSNIESDQVAYAEKNTNKEKDEAHDDTNVNGASTNKIGMKSPKNDKSKDGNDVTVTKKDHSNHMVWNVNNQRLRSSHSLSDDILSSNVDVTPKKGISPFKKKSQKDRKKEQLLSVDPSNNVELENVEVEKSVCPWATFSQQTPQVSFREVLSEEKSPLEKGVQPKRRSVSSPHGSVSEKKQGNPWRSPSNSESQKADSHSFAKIIDVQQEEKKHLTDQAKKPLSVIQMEEKAIEQLLKHYELVTAQGEYITIKRIKPVTAAPFWEVEINK